MGDNFKFKQLSAQLHTPGGGIISMDTRCKAIGPESIDVGLDKDPYLRLVGTSDDSAISDIMELNIGCNSFKFTN